MQSTDFVNQGLDVMKHYYSYLGKAEQLLGTEWELVWFSGKMAVSRLGAERVDSH